MDRELPVADIISEDDGDESVEALLLDENVSNVSVTAEEDEVKAEGVEEAALVDEELPEADVISEDDFVEDVEKALLLDEIVFTITVVPDEDTAEGVEELLLDEGPAEVDAMKVEVAADDVEVKVWAVEGLLVEAITDDDDVLALNEEANEDVLTGGGWT
ncbi:hypothetical protein MMC07_005993 [Pseudocyphellaria aurata]|nr:hypothetical protein [Pseudocyphellaria aurata]